MKKKILFITKFVPAPAYGGGLKRNFAWIKFLSKYYKVDVIGYWNKDFGNSKIKELKKYTNPLNEDIARLERELKLITSEIKEKDVLEKELNKTIKTVDDILNNQTITNAMLKTIIDVIEVDSDSNVEVRLKLLNEIGTNEPVITKFEDIYQNGEDAENKDANNNEKNSTVTKSNISA